MSSSTRAQNPAESLFWDLIDELRSHDERVEEGTIMGGRCARVSGEFLGLVGYKGSGMVVNSHATALTNSLPRASANRSHPLEKVFREWVAIMKTDRRRWSKLLVEAVAFVAPPKTALTEPLQQ